MWSCLPALGQLPVVGRVAFLALPRSQEGAWRERASRAEPGCRGTLQRCCSGCAVRKRPVDGGMILAPLRYSTVAARMHRCEGSRSDYPAYGALSPKSCHPEPCVLSYKKPRIPKVHCIPNNPGCAVYSQSLFCRVPSVCYPAVAE